MPSCTNTLPIFVHPSNVPAHSSSCRPAPRCAGSIRPEDPKLGWNVTGDSSWDRKEIANGYRTEIGVVIDPDNLEVTELHERQRVSTLGEVTARLRSAGFTRIDCMRTCRVIRRRTTRSACSFADSSGSGSLDSFARLTRTGWASRPECRSRTKGLVQLGELGGILSGSPKRRRIATTMPSLDQAT